MSIMGIISNEAKDEMREVAREVYKENMSHFSAKLIKKLLPVLKKLGYEEPLISAEEACRVLNVSIHTLRHYRNNSGLPFNKTTRPYKYRRSELYEWMKKRDKKVDEANQDPMIQELQQLISSIQG